jgi:hypothetical protein
VRHTDPESESEIEQIFAVSVAVNAHDHHAAAAHPGTPHSPADANGAVGKQPRVPGDPVATAASQGHTVNFYKGQVDQWVGNLFDTKVRAIDNFAPSLSRSEAPHSFLGSAVAFALVAAADPFVDALDLAAVAAVIIKNAIPIFADQVGASIGGGASGPEPVDVATFATIYGQAIDKHRSIVSANLNSQIHNEQDGKRITEGLHGDLVAGHLYLTTTQVYNLNNQTQNETLDAWTVAMQKVGDKKDHNQQGYSDPSTGQLHLDGLTLLLNGTFRHQGGVATMEKVGNAAAQKNGDRKLEDIKVQRTFNIRWDYPDGSGAFGLSISAGGVMREDEFGDDDKTAVAMFYDRRELFPTPGADLQRNRAIVDSDYPKGLQKIWNLVKDKTPHELGFSVKGD